MFGINRLSIKSKLQIMLLVASLGSILVVGYLSWSKAREILTERIFDQLTSVRASKAYQVESYFQTLRHHIETLCEDRMVVSAMVEFNQAFAQLNQASIPGDWERDIEGYYTNEFLPRLTKNIIGTPVYETYRPTKVASRYLQYHYIANNPNPVGKKDELEQAQDGSDYSRIHARYHALFRNLIKKFGYYDLFLIDSRTGIIVYSVYKETDYSTSLEEGPYRSSNLAEVVKKVRANPDRGAIQIVDFQFYRPSYNAPAAFFAGSIYDGDQEVGILAAQLPVDEINNVLFQVIRGAVILSITAYVLGATWNIDLSKIAAAAGVGSLVMALALQDTLSNLVSGFLLILEAPFKVGDWIRVGEIEGEVIEINWRAVRLKTRNRDVVIIPNGSLGKDTIENYTLIDPLHLMRMTLRFSYFDPPNRVIQMLKQTALATKGIVSEPPPSIDTQGFTNTAIEYEVQVCIKDFIALEDIEAEFMTRVYYAAKRYKFTLPYGDRVEYKLNSFPTEQGITTEEIAASLKTIPYFTFLDTNTIEYLAQSATVEYFGIGERIVQAGELDRKIFIILEGSVLISVKDLNNREQEVVFLSNGDLFGETALLQGEVSKVSVTVIDDFKAIALEPDTVINIVERYPKFAMEINSFIQIRKQAIGNAKRVEQPANENTQSSENGKLHPLWQFGL